MSNRGPSRNPYRKFVYEDAGQSFHAFLLIRQMQQQGLGWEDIEVRMKKRGFANLNREWIKRIVLGREPYVHREA